MEDNKRKLSDEELEKVSGGMPDDKDMPGQHYDINLGMWVPDTPGTN